jgi:hypothetical protein
MTDLATIEEIIRRRNRYQQARLAAMNATIALAESEPEHADARSTHLKALLAAEVEATKDYFDYCDEHLRGGR